MTSSAWVQGQSKECYTTRGRGFPLLEEPAFVAFLLDCNRGSLSIGEELVPPATLAPAALLMAQPSVSLPCPSWASPLPFLELKSQHFLHLPRGISRLHSPSALSHTTSTSLNILISVFNNFTSSHPTTHVPILPYPSEAHLSPRNTFQCCEKHPTHSSCHSWALSSPKESPFAWDQLHCLRCPHPSGGS